MRPGRQEKEAPQICHIFLMPVLYWAAQAGDLHDVTAKLVIPREASFRKRLGSHPARHPSAGTGRQEVVCPNEAIASESSVVGSRLHIR